MEEVEVVAELEGIEVFRRDIDIGGDDKYGHWWIEIGPEESYGWWPKYPFVGKRRSIKYTVIGVEGELNGQTSFGGTPTRDVHHGDRRPGTNRFEVFAKDGRTADEVRQEIRDFANSFGESVGHQWSWPLGPNCHTFQYIMFWKLDLEIRGAP